MKAPKPAPPSPPATDLPPRRRHYAFTVEPVRGGFKVDQVSEWASRGQADKRSLTLLGHYGGDAEAIALEDRELKSGDVLEASLLKR